MVEGDLGEARRIGSDTFLVPKLAEEINCGLRVRARLRIWSDITGVTVRPIIAADPSVGDIRGGRGVKAHKQDFRRRKQK